MSVEIYTPTINEVTQAVYNLNATKHLLEWHDWLTGYCGPIMYTGFTEHNPLAHAPRPLDILDQPGDLVLDDSVDKITILHACDKEGNPVEPDSVIKPWISIPFNIIPPDDGVYYMVKREEINGKVYSFYSPCHPTDKPGEGEELVRFEKPLKPIWPDILRVPPEPTISEVSLVGESIRKPIPEGSYYQPTVTLADWGPNNFPFKF